MTEAPPPDLISQSGRESLRLVERVGLLEADLMREPFLGIDDRTRATSQTIHDLKLTVGAVRCVVAMYQLAKRRGTADDVLERGAPRMVTPYECWVLAWRRGGHLEWQRVRHEQRRLRLI